MEDGGGRITGARGFKDIRKTSKQGPTETDATTRASAESDLSPPYICYACVACSCGTCTNGVEVISDSCLFKGYFSSYQAA